MLSFALIIGCAVLMGKIAASEERSAIIWGCVSGLVCLFSGALIPFPFVGILAGFIACFLFMALLNMRRK